MGNPRAGALASLSRVVARAAYAGAFTIALPALLVAWARSADRFIHLPALYAPAGGAALAAAGIALVVWASIALYRDGGGLPMNAFPPPRFVGSGPYRFLAHPIYVGFCAAVFAWAVAVGSASGLWMVGPATALGCAALVFGYEAADLRRRFGRNLPRPFLSLPPDSAAPARASDRVSAIVLVALPWLVLYGAAMLLGPASDAIVTWLHFELRLPIIEEAELLYASTYPVAAAAIFIPRTRGDARKLLVRALLSMAVVFPLYFLLPFVAPPRPFVARGWLGWLLLEERAHDTMAAALPSFHVVWALLAADAWAGRFPKAASAAYAWAGLVAVSCVLTGMHSIADVAAGALVLLAVTHAGTIWEALRRAAERIANRWTEWRIGPFRILGYGLWAALANAAALSVVSAMMGPGKLGLVYATAAAGLSGAFLWARLFERPAKEMRPFGFYGGMFGIWAAAAASPLFGVASADAYRLLAGYCAAAPLLQAIGRVRCLMQGCCHGAPASDQVGIRYHPPLSRVTKAGLGGIPLHPTPLYSILWNGVVALVVLRLWRIRAGPGALCGAWLMLSGLGRFVEESFRGEPQTPSVAGLRLYQWVAMATVLAGAVLLALPPGAPLPPARLDAAGIASALVAGAVAWFAYGVDFPDSGRRYSRLA
jgi:prolipoprotein diacylglyceryltransferase/protein-S-isoprenylcysteine O-methyltransferase Ste14